VAASVLGGFRTPAIVALWLQADRLAEERRWWALRTRYELIVELEPRIPAAWGLLADRLMLDMAGTTKDPDASWAWVREGLEMLDRGLRANPDSYWLRLQKMVRLTAGLAWSEDRSARFLAWRGRTVKEEALEAARRLAALRPGRAQERLAEGHVHKAFAYVEFRRAWDSADPAARAEGFRRAAAGYREAERAYRAAREEGATYVRYAAAFADLADALAEVRDRTRAERMAREALSPFTDFLEVRELLDTEKG
jgi:hypothetical protein